MKTMNKVLLALALVVPGVSMAAVDVTQVTAAATDIAAVGAAVFAVYIAIKLVHWIRRAL